MAKISSVFNKEVKKETHPRRITTWIHYTKLVSNRHQYCEPKDREEVEALADLIQADGEVLQDLLIRKNDADEYVIIAGHKRKAACQLLVEERNLKEFEFLPCIEKNISDVRAEFQVYSSNGHHVETPYETMHKLERMQYLLKNYPEEFPGIQKGRMVERLARQFSLSKSTVGEYQKIANNLGEKAMEAFKDGSLDKSAAVTLASLPEEEQDGLLEQGITKNVDIQNKIKEQEAEAYETASAGEGPIRENEVPVLERKSDLDLLREMKQAGEKKLNRLIRQDTATDEAVRKQELLVKALELFYVESKLGSLAP